MQETPPNNDPITGTEAAAPAVAPATPDAGATAAPVAESPTQLLTQSPAGASTEVAPQSPANAGGETPVEAATEAAAAGEAAPAEQAEQAGKEAPQLSPAVVAAMLAERFPALFGAGRALPIKLRIQADIQQRAPGVFTKKALSIFLHRYTTSTAYLKALVAQPQRLDLDGQPAGEIEAVHKEAAAAEVQRRKALVDERRAAEREAQREAQRKAQQARRKPAAGQAPAAPAEGANGTDGTDGAGAPAANGEGTAAAPRPARHQRPPRGGAAGERAPRPPREGGREGGRDAVREGRPDRRPDNRRPDRADRPQTPRPEPRGEARPDRRPAPGVQEPQGVYDSAELEARRNRATLLRAWEETRLTMANFCVLKRISEADLQAQLAQARSEREQRGPRPEPRR